MIVDDMYYAKAQISKPQSLICYNLFYFFKICSFPLGILFEICKLELYLSYSIQLTENIRMLLRLFQEYYNFKWKILCQLAASS